MALTAEQLELLYGMNDAHKTPQIMSFKVDGNEITCYASYSFFQAKSYDKAPIRGVGGVIDNLNSYSTFLTPRLRVKFSMMPLETYRTIMKLIQSKNEFLVECYDVVWDRTIKFKAYFSTEDYPELFIYDLYTLGVIGYEIELQGTNADLDYISIVYHRNPRNSSGEQIGNGIDSTEGEYDLTIGQEVIIGQSTSFPTETFGGLYKFKEWNTQADGKGMRFDNMVATTIASDLVLYAIWEATDMATLSYNYGLSRVATDNSSGVVTEIRTKSVQQGQTIGALPQTDDEPIVTIDKKDYRPYYGGGWYKLPTLNSTRVDENTAYWTNYNSTIYRLYEVRKYPISYVTNQDNIVIEPQSVEYNTNVTLPLLYKENKNFDGWYEKADFSGSRIKSLTMPPYNVTLYAKWSDKTQ